MIFTDPVPGLAQFNIERESWNGKGPIFWSWDLSSHITKMLELQHIVSKLKYTQLPSFSQSPVERARETISKTKLQEYIGSLKGGQPLESAILVDELEKKGQKCPTTRSQLLEVFEQDTRGSGIFQKVFPSVLHVFERDTKLVIRHMTTELRKAQVEMAGDHLSLEKVDHWRHMVRNAQVIIQRLEESLADITSSANLIAGQPNLFLHEREATEGNDDPSARCDIGAISRYNVSRILDILEGLRKETNQTYTTLLSVVSIVEAQKAMAEAERLAKLTELAFLFIPLSFSTSIFGMQVKVLYTPCC